MNKKTFISTILLGLCLAVLCFSTERVQAQEKASIKANLRIPDSSNVQILTTRDGSTIIGQIIEIGASKIRFKTDLGEMTIPILKVKEIKEVPVSSIRGGKYWFPNPNATRLYFAPTGRMIKQGGGYFADYYLFFPMVIYGITDNITIGGGMSLVPGLGIDRQIFYFTPKVGLKAAQNLNLAAGALVIKLPDFSDDDDDGDVDGDDDDNPPLVGILYGVGTYGTPDGSITVGLGYGFVDDDFAEKPMIVIGGEKRLSRRTAFVTENWILPGVDRPVISYGIRFFGEKLSVDLAFLNSLSEDAIFPGIPYIDFVFNF